jgi:hypothetical protein
VPLKTAKGGLKMLKSAPSGIANTILHPAKTAEEFVNDETSRHSQSFKKQVKRIRKEGAAPELLDAAGVASLGGATVGRAVLRAAERRGANWATAARPKLRDSGGIAREQGKAGTAGRLAAQRTHDRLRNRKLKKSALRADELHPTNPVHVEALKHGDVVRLRSGKLDRTLAKAVAKTKSAGVHRLKAEQARLVDREGRREIAKLNKHERRAFYYVTTGQAPATRAGLTKYLGERQTSIVRARAADGVEPKGLLRRTDELRTIPKIDVDKIDFAKLRATHRKLLPTAIKVGREDPALTAAQRLSRRYAQQAEALGLKRGEIPAAATDGVPQMAYGEEKLSDFVKRVKAAADQQGHETPAYFPSERYDMELQPDHASRAVGGTRAVRGPQRYAGKNFRLGIQDTSPDVYLTGLSRNLKRKHNWRLVTQLASEHALGNLRGSAKGVREAAMQRGYDPKDYVLWNPRVFRQRMEHLESDAPDLQAELHDLGPEAYTTDALAKSRDASGQYAEDSGWIAIPRKAWKEIEDSAKPSGAVGRSWDIFKAKNSRVLLGVGNIPWLQFQVASNAMLAGVATRGTLLVDLPKTMKWWKGLDDATKEELDALLGSGTTHDIAQPHLGAAANNSIVNAYRGFKQLPIWDAKVKGRGPSLRNLNPIEASFAADRAQNALFKRTVLYNQVKREAFHRMGERMNLAQRLQGRVAHALTLGPREAMDALIRDKAAIEHHADVVNDWLGDYTTYTAAERKVLNRAVMFYGFMRYSLKFVFYTMPVKHPVETAIIGKLGQLQADEIEKLLGGADLPWAFGKLYLTQDGQLKSIDLSRANPALNTITQSFSDKPSNWTSVLPPVAVSTLEQLPGIGGRKFWADRSWRVGGKSAPYGSSRSSYSNLDAARVFADEMLSMAAPYRIGETLTQEGPQGDDSMLFDQRPMSYSGRTRRGKAILKSINDQKAFDKSAESLIGELVPLLPQASNDVHAAKNQAAIDKAAKPLPKTKTYGVKRTGTTRTGRSGTGQRTTG